MGNLESIQYQIDKGIIEEKIQKNDKEFLESLRKHKFTSDEMLRIIYGKFHETFKFVIDECEYDFNYEIINHVFYYGSFEMLKHLKDKSYDFSKFSLTGITNDHNLEEEIKFLVEECNVPITREFLNRVVTDGFTSKAINILRYIKSKGISSINITSNSINHIKKHSSSYSKMIKFLINEYDMDPKLFLKN